MNDATLHLKMVIFPVSLLIHSTGNASCLGDVPVADRLVELLGTFEHKIHGGHLQLDREM